MVGRALDLVLRRWGHGFEVASLKKAAHGLLASCDKLAVVNEGVTCCYCGHAKPVMNGLVADAGQFFEVVQPAVAIQSVVDVMRAVQTLHGCCTVTVVRDKRVRGFLGGSPQANCRMTRSKSFYFVDLALCFAACMLVDLCKLGSVVIRISGLPIGGLLSRIAASYVLAWQEYLWTRNWPDSTFGAQARVAWAQAVVARRYIDDVMFISKLFCFDCLSAMVAAMYSVDFEVTANSRQLRWLDIVFDLDSRCIGIKRSSFMFPPDWDTGQSDLKAFLLGRLARYRQLALSRKVWEQDLGCLLMSLSKQQFSRRRLRNLVFCMWKDQFHDEIFFLRDFVWFRMVSMPGYAAFQLVAILVTCFLCPTSAMGWPNSKGRSWGWQSHQSHQQQQWRQPYGGTQVLRIEVDRKDERDQHHRRSKGHRSHDSHSSRKREKSKKQNRKSSRETRLEQELETLRAEKTAREAALQKEKFQKDMETQVQAIRADLQEQLDAKLDGLKCKPAASTKFTAPGKGNSAEGEAVEDAHVLSASEKMAVFHALGGYEPVKACKGWGDLGKHLQGEDGDRLRSLVRLVQKKGGLPRTPEAMASKILSVLKASLAEFSA
ncbi:unnamed protein product [Symbiodinium necroappetens]|uniref:Uncharacterized protein n=1 Tax=Symbiodinium necroappetens TaxID=1628268 RepID=A0A812YMF4_9DINO|nr:unnamed protein product [Symbiodinium necroappetens]